ncbi:MAG: ComF family protein [Desulfobacterales bacterium]|nr:ComF family protein [Desulfobacterales bacterium]
MSADTLSRVGRSLSDALFPKICYACGSFVRPAEDKTRPSLSDSDLLPLETAFTHVMRAFLCTDCMADFVPVRPPFCSRCGRPFKSSIDESHLCGDCISRKKHFSSARACAVYQGVVLKLIHAYKYQGKTALAEPFGLLLYLAFIRHFAGKQIDAAVAVPLHYRRLRTRGYNQALLMLRHWPGFAEKNRDGSGLEIAIETDALIRRKNTASQTGLGRRERTKNMKNAFAVKSPQRIAGRNILLIDDVYTTGSTSEECSRVLERAGAAEVHILSLARAM